VEGDPELRPDGTDSAVWLVAHEFTLLAWREGGIEARDPTPELLEKMRRMAIALHAAVHDDREIQLLAEPKPKPPRGPLRLDPLQWQIVSYLFAAVLIVVAVALFLLVRS
jgi:hypothetical protein